MSRGERLAWLAGIVDGEGSICASVRRGAMFWRMQVAIYNTNAAIISEVADILSSLEVLHHVTSRDNRGWGRKRVSIVVVSGRPQVHRLLTTLRPYLIGKAGHADAAIALCERRDAMRVKESRSRTIADIRTDPAMLENYAALRRLNK